MKQTRLWLATIVVLLCSLTASAYDFEVDGIYYNIISANDFTVEVTSGDNYYSGDVIIPSTINYSGKTMTVTSIDDFAFNNCAELIGVTIPYTVTSIGGGLFSYCEGLTNIVVESGNSVYDSRDNCNAIIETNSNTLIAGSKNTTIPNSVTNIGAHAFSGCLGLTSITIPNSVTSIGESAFNGCWHLTSITIPQSVTDIESFAFTGCSELTNFTIPNSVTSIGNRAFEDTGWWNNQQDGLIYKDDWLLGYKGSSRPIFDIVIQAGTRYIADNALAHCSGLTSIEIPNSVTGIGYEAFAYCNGLTSITIPNSVTSIEDNAFYNCNAIEKLELNCSEINSWFRGNQSVREIVIGNNVTSIAEYAFSYCSGLTSITIPNSVTSIGEYAFSYCDELTSVTIGNGITSIGYDPFSDCNAIEKLELNCPEIGFWFCWKPSIKEVTLGNSVTNIGNNAFSGCSGITSIEIPSSVTNIGNHAFSNCSGLTSIVIPNSVTNIGNGAFSYCSGFTSIDIPNSITSIENNAFSYCSGLTNITIPNNVTSIEEYAFSCCDGLASVVIGNGVTSIGNNAFDGCSGLINITIGNSVTSIGNGAFYGCNAIEKLELNCPDIDSWFRGYQSIKELTLGNSVTSIGENAFFNCDGLTCVEIPSSVTNIGNEAFSNCSGLTNVIIGNDVTCIGNGAFFYCDGLTSVIIGNSVTSIGEYAFEGCNAIKKLELNCPVIDSWFRDKQSIKEVIIGDDVNEIREYAFYGCSGMTNINIPNSVTSIGEYVFFCCDGLTSIEIPSSVTGIGEYAFYGCSGLTSVDIPSSVTSIGKYAFYGCSRITDMTIPNNVASIGESAFEGTAWYNNQPDGIIYAGNVLYDYKGTMPENTDITIVEGTLGIAGGAFQHCSGLTSITIPNSMSNIGKNAFWDCYALKKINSFIPAENLFVPDDYAFEGVNKETCTLYVPEGDVSAYQSTVGWNEFEHIVDFDPHFTIIYVVDGEVYSTETAEYGSEVLLIDEPKREGYTFSGWSEVPETMPTNDITVYGTFTANKYFITFKIDDEVIFSAPIEYSTSIVAPEAPEKDGYSFEGWIEMPETMPAHDVIVYGTFTKLKVETIVINDSDFSFSMEENTECGEIIYTRTFNNTDWQALYIPFEIAYEDICDDFEIADINNVHQYDYNEDGKTDETIIEAFKVTSGTLEANYPYLIRAKEAGEKTIVVTDATLYATEENSIDCSSVREKFTFTGTYKSNTLPQGEGYYTLIEGEWKPVTEAVTLGAFRFYLKVDSRSGAAAAEARSIRLRVIGENGDDNTTGIDNLGIRNQKSEIIYDLQGRRVENPTKGIYIVNGKRVVIK